MASEGILSVSVASAVENVMNQHNSRLSDSSLASRKEEEAATRRYEAAGWLRKMVGVIGGAKDLPEEPSEEEFRIGLRNGIILCNALNKVHPGAVPKVVEAPADFAVLPDGAALSAYQYFENLRNFLCALEEMGLPTFEASDLQKGGKGSRVVNSVLALRSYHECKQKGRNFSWKYGGVLKPASTGKYFVSKNSEPFMYSLSRTQAGDKFQDGLSLEQNLSADFSIESTEMTTSHSLNMLVRTILSDKKPDEVPMLVESMLSKVMKEFERRTASQNEMVKTTLKDLADDNISNDCLSKQDVLSEDSSASDETKGLIDDNTDDNNSFSEMNVLMEVSSASGEMKMDMVDKIHVCSKDEDTLNERLQKRHIIVYQQQREIQELKHALHMTRAGMEFMKSQCSEEFSSLGKRLQILAHAALGYHKVLEENRKLYNQVQDLKGNIRVYCRVRPFLPGQFGSMSTLSRIDDGNITVMTPAKNCKEGHKTFTFNKVFGPTATQEAVFSDTQPLIRSVLDGYNVCIFAYGQTGSGKTYTMSGPKELTEEALGVNYRALNDLFYISEQRTDTFCYEIAVQMIEIYNEQVRDLLSNDGGNRRLEIRNSSQKGLNVPDANLVPVASTSDVIELMNLGQKNRAVSSTAMNDRSSRSHCCLTIHVQGRDLTSGNILRGCMHLVDLAGSERVDKSKVKGDRLKEAQHINKSLSALGDVISALAQKNTHVPYRNSKLTQLLQDSLGGQAKTLMFVHISPEVDAIGETIGTLKFAERVATVELGAAKKNKDNGEIKELREQIASLKAALARREGETEHVRSTMSSPDIHRMKSGASSPSFPRFGQPMEDVGNIEFQSNSALMQKKADYDIQELSMETNPSPWPESCPVIQKMDDKETSSGEWVDKVIINKHEVVIGVEDSPRDSEGDDTQPAVYSYKKISPDAGIYNEQHRNQAESVASDDSDDLDLAASDSSEQDMLWQFSIPKPTAAVSAVGSRIKKPQTKPIKSLHVGTSLIQSPSREVSNGPGQTMRQPGRIPVSGGIGGKRPVSGKVPSGSGCTGTLC
ncbi:kinesin-like protein KIN-14P [Phoenix dactylifera]|uniref:Kinesin-like protein KIN-14P n=1 Tax=Phoenix dactylifera TaxID=42345 RepID=A0A8B7MV43_PHODC|nr:kinesin-like protein KIN-14P [Phoenix dactylifera]